MTTPAVDGLAERFDRDGFVVLDDVVSPEACIELARRADAIVAEQCGADGPMSVFTTDEQERHSDAQFLSSGDRIACFYEAEAFDADGTLVVPVDRAVNKIGHAMHDLDPVFVAFSRTPELARIARRLGLHNHVLWQSMFIFKHPLIGGEVAAHDDHTFLWTDPPSCVGFWFAIDDADVDNGALWVAPGAHRREPGRRFRRVSDDPADGTTFDEIGSPPDRDLQFVPLEVRRGGLAVLHGLLPHRSGPNRSERSRRAYTLHLIDPAADYPPDNWLQRTGLVATGFGDSR